MSTDTQPDLLQRRHIDPRSLKVLSDPTRSLIVYAVVEQPKTAKQLAEEFGVPVTRLYHHLKQLEKHGFVVVESTRWVSGILEKSYRAAAREFLLDRSALAADSGGSEALLAFVFDQSRQEIGRQIASGAIDLGKRAPAVDSLIAYRNLLRLDEHQAARLYQRLYDFWQEYEEVARHAAPDGRFYAFCVALYPNALDPAAPDTESGKAQKGTRGRPRR
jgi:DNA-binding transcriptional ArsR family regulator